LLLCLTRAKDALLAVLHKIAQLIPQPLDDKTMLLAKTHRRQKKTSGKRF
jgi:hypothetical protein